MNIKFLKHLVIFVCCGLLLTACSGSHDAKYYVRHPEAMKSGLMRCEQLAHPNQNTQCVRLITIYNQLVKMANSLVKDPEAFGQSIIQKQNQLAHLKQKLSQAKSNDQIQPLRNQYDSLNKEIQLMLTMVAQAEGM